METKIITIKFYPSRYWFWYFRKNKYLKGFIVRIFGIHIMVKEKDFIKKAIHINKIIQLLKINGIDHDSIKYK